MDRSVGGGTTTTSSSSDIPWSGSGCGGSIAMKLANNRGPNKGTTRDTTNHTGSIFFNHGQVIIILVMLIMMRVYIWRTLVGGKPNSGGSWPRGGGCVGGCCRMGRMLSILAATTVRANHGNVPSSSSRGGGRITTTTRTGIA